MATWQRRYLLSSLPAESGGSSEWSRSHNQAPVPTPELERLAGEYLLAGGRSVKGRIAQIKYLLRDAIKAFSGENGPDAKLITALFFGDSQHYVTKSASELLDTARRQYEFGNELRFRQAWHTIDSFAEFLLRFVASVTPANETGALVESVTDGVSYNHDSVLCTRGAAASRDHRLRRQRGAFHHAAVAGGQGNDRRSHQRVAGLDAQDRAGPQA